MSLSTPTPKFLLDENVHFGLKHFLESKNFDVKFCPKGAADAVLSEISVAEKRILVSNDYDFAAYPKEKLWGLVLLKLPQGDASLLTDCFSRLLETGTNLEGKIIVLYFDKELEFNLGNKPEV